MAYEVDMNAMRDYIVNKFKDEGDFDFLKEGELSSMVDTLIALDDEYMKKAQVEEGEVYDDDDAYDMIFEGMQKKYPDYKMYCMRLAEDYLDFAEEYLASVGAIEWD